MSKKCGSTIAYFMYKASHEFVLPHIFLKYKLQNLYFKQNFKKVLQKNTRDWR